MASTHHRRFRRAGALALSVALTGLTGATLVTVLAPAAPAATVSDRFLPPIVIGGNAVVAGSGANLLDGPRGLDVSSNVVAVADSGNARVQGFTAANYMGHQSGETVAGGNGDGSAADQLSGPADVAVDPNEPGGVFYVADSGNNRVVAWANGVGAIGTLGTTGSGPAQFNGPSSIEIGRAHV